MVMKDSTAAAAVNPWLGSSAGTPPGIVRASREPAGSGAFDTRAFGVGRRRTVHQEPRNGKTPRG
jgi:hypothetical protein